MALRCPVASLGPTSVRRSNLRNGRRVTVSAPSGSQGANGGNPCSAGRPGDTPRRPGGRQRHANPRRRGQWAKERRGSRRATRQGKPRRGYGAPSAGSPAARGSRAAASTAAGGGEPRGLLPQRRKQHDHGRGGQEPEGSPRGPPQPGDPRVPGGEHDHPGVRRLRGLPRDGGERSGRRRAGVAQAGRGRRGAEEEERETVAAAPSKGLARANRRARPLRRPAPFSGRPRFPGSRC